MLLMVLIPDAIDLVTTTVLNIEIGKVGNKIPDLSGLMTTAVLNIKISKVENKVPDYVKYIITPEFNKFGSIFDTKLKQVSLATKSNIDAVSQCANKIKDKIIGNFLGKICFWWL